ncbi:MAG: TlpA family protein disulfide reductase [Bacteroidales bacterium]|nr:TlpA family protein disulfide reductase [Bacteroidales bacterium]
MAVICGKSDTGSDAYIRLVRIDTSAYTPIDSVKPDRSGSFCLAFQPDMPGLYLLEHPDRKSVPVVVYPGDSIKATIRQGEVTLSGGKEAGTFDHFRQLLVMDEEKVDSLGSVAMLARDLDIYPKIKRSTDSSWAMLMKNARERGIVQIKANPGFLSQIFVINSKIQQTFLFDQIADSSWFYKADSQLMAVHSLSPHVQAFHNRIGSLRESNRQEARARENMKPGKQAPEISLPGINGKSITLSPATKRFTLVYIWSPVDGPSRKANQELKMLHEQFKNTGFEVFAVSLDNYKDRWAAAVNLDKLWWINVNDTMAMNSPVVKNWYVNRLPVFVLVDQQGKIVDRYTSTNSLKARLSFELGK